MFLAIFLSLSAAFAGEEKLTCLKEGKLRSLYNGKVTESVTAYCFNKDKNMLISPGFDKTRITRKKIGHKMISSPGFEACFAFQGKPELLEFEVEGKWYELDRCVFRDKSFIDNGWLYQLSQ